jgi:predicted GIY-YIG superfamily endonuclease
LTGCAWRSHAKTVREILRSVSVPEQNYIDVTADLKQRLVDHNARKSAHTSKFVPWELIWYSAFPEKFRALEFDRKT